MIRVLATDLDGTLIPLTGNADHIADLRHLAQLIQQHSVTLLYATGRHPSSVFEAMAQYQLPMPEWAICDVGTTILQRSATGDFEFVVAYETHLNELSNHFSADNVRQLCGAVDGAKLQEPEKQGRFKISFYTDVKQLSGACLAIQSLLKKASAEWSVISSVDPFTNDGLIDVLPKGVSKAHAIEWWRMNHGFQRHEIAYSGDSCNDLAALTAGYHGIVVANAAKDLRQQLSNSSQKHSLLFATKTATSGVLEGLSSMITNGTESD